MSLDRAARRSRLACRARSARAVDAKFNKFVDKALEGLSIDKDEIVMLKFQNIVNGYLANNDVRKLDSEQLFVRKKIDESMREIQQLENNLSFFLNASDDNPLVKNVYKSISDFKQGLDIWKKKLAYLKTWQVESLLMINTMVITEMAKDGWIQAPKTFFLSLTVFLF